MRENALKNSQKGYSDINRNQSCFGFEGKWRGKERVRAAVAAFPSPALPLLPSGTTPTPPAPAPRQPPRVTRRNTPGNLHLGYGRGKDNYWEGRQRGRVFKQTVFPKSTGLTWSASPSVGSNSGNSPTAHGEMPVTAALEHPGKKPRTIRGLIQMCVYMT